MAAPPGGLAWLESLWLVEITNKGRWARDLRHLNLDDITRFDVGDAYDTPALLAGEPPSVEDLAARS